MTGLPQTEPDEIRRRALDLAPWRKGPFDLNGVRIDGHWKSDLKWKRALGFAGDLRGADILDVGCNNGYYLFEMRKAGAASAVGLDPVEKFEAQFHFVREFYPDPEVRFVRAGFERAGEFPSDVVFCMGVLYHQKNAAHLIECLAAAMRPGGRMVLETLGLDIGEHCLIPRGRYAGASGIWQIPGPGAVENWCRRTGLKCDLADVWDARDEQQRTEFADLPLTSDFYHNDRTVEGYPIAMRYLFLVRR